MVFITKYFCAWFYTDFHNCPPAPQEALFRLNVSPRTNAKSPGLGGHSPKAIRLHGPESIHGGLWGMYLPSPL
jgi:hypothetical protein